MTFRKWLLVAAVLFTIGIIWGLTLPTEGGGLLAGETAALSDLGELIGSLPVMAMFLIIFVKNVSVVVFSILFGPLFLLFPIFALVINGGIMVRFASSAVRYWSAFFSPGLPYGIFELPPSFSAKRSLSASAGGSHGRFSTGEAALRCRTSAPT
jgi:hypothetical protein